MSTRLTYVETELRKFADGISHIVPNTSNWFILAADIVARSGRMNNTINEASKRLIWIAPVGSDELLGFMVCKREKNNRDGRNTRIVFLDKRGFWKKTFLENHHMHATYELAFEAMLAAVERIAPVT